MCIRIWQSESEAEMSDRICLDNCKSVDAYALGGGCAIAFNREAFYQALFSYQGCRSYSRRRHRYFGQVKASLSAYTKHQTSPQNLTGRFFMASAIK
ncbi:MAG: hypothetical protein V7K83_06290 [Nostoc sp.]